MPPPVSVSSNPFRFASSKTPVMRLIWSLHDRQRV